MLVAEELDVISQKKTAEKKYGDIEFVLNILYNDKPYNRLGAFNIFA